jgi:hypothetical protein
MFFHVSNQQQENFPCQWRMGNFFIGTDAGWQERTVDHCDVLYKGYADSDNLDALLEQIVQQSIPQLTGNFCAIVYDRTQKQLHIKSDRYRSFPIYYDGYATSTYLTNLVAGPCVVYTNGIISVDDNFTVIYTDFDVVGNLDTFLESTVDQIDQLLSTKIQKFAAQLSAPIKVALTGGVDTMLIYSYLQRYNIPHEMVWNFHYDIDDFWLDNHHDIVQNWGYRQIHHWRNPSVLMSGTPGDEFTLRGPQTANLYLLHHGTDIPTLLTSIQPASQFEYLSLYKHSELFAQQHQDHDSTKLTQTVYHELCNNVLNDWQHWHLGNTLTWTPLRDLELFKLFLRLPRTLTQSQIVDSAVSKILIERNAPTLLQAISEQKNSRNYMKNLKNLLH